MDLHCRRPINLTSTLDLIRTTILPKVDTFYLEGPYFFNTPLYCYVWFLMKSVKQIFSSTFGQGYKFKIIPYVVWLEYFLPPFFLFYLLSLYNVFWRIMYHTIDENYTNYRWRINYSSNLKHVKYYSHLVEQEELQFHNSCFYGCHSIFYKAKKIHREFHLPSGYKQLSSFFRN